MKKGILLSGVCVLAVAAGFAAGSLNSSAHYYVGGSHHYMNCTVGNLASGGHHSEHWSNAAVCWEQCSQNVCVSKVLSVDYCKPEMLTTNYCEPSTPTADYCEPETPAANYCEPIAPTADYCEPEMPAANYCEPIAPAADYCEPETPAATYCEPVYQENYSAGSHHTESHHGHGGRHH